MPSFAAQQTNRAAMMMRELADVKAVVHTGLDVRTRKNAGMCLKH